MIHVKVPSTEDLFTTIWEVGMTLIKNIGSN